MAMNKKERAAFHALTQELRIAKALRFTEPVNRDIAPPTDSGIRNGWDFNDYSEGFVKKACTSASYHSFGCWDKTDSQRPRMIYSSRLLALRAMRHSMEKKYAAILANVDAEIEKELSSNGGEGR